MSDQARRKELLAHYKQTPPEAGVYRIVNSRNNKALLGATPNLASVRNRLAFAKSTNSPGGLDPQLSKDIRQFGLDAFSLEVLEILQPRPEMTSAEIRAELAILEELWREQLDPALLY
jgi:hypothetical protein